MTKITNTDTHEALDVTIITTHDGELRWCIAVWATPSYGRSKVDGNGHAWQVVRANENGSYSYNNSMMGGWSDSLDEAKDRAVRSGYVLL